MTKSKNSPTAKSAWPSLNLKETFEINFRREPARPVPVDARRGKQAFAPPSLLEPSKFNWGLDSRARFKSFRDDMLTVDSEPFSENASTRNQIHSPQFKTNN